jgi:hypothetical protein
MDKTAMRDDELFEEWLNYYEDETLGDDNAAARATQADRRVFGAHLELRVFERPTIEGEIDQLEIETLGTQVTVTRTKLKGVRMRFFRLKLFQEGTWGAASGAALSVFDSDDREASERVEDMRSILNGLPV